MRISNDGIALIKRFEGLELEAYRDAVGILTIGYGHTGDDVFEGQVISEAEAEALLRRDLDRFEVAVNEGIRIKTAQSMFDAFVSLSFNIGASAFKKSTALKRHNKKEYTSAAEAITWWNKAGGRVLGGLVRRRAAEEALYLESLGELTDEIEVASNEIEENTPRRNNPVTTRTTAGAGTAGAAGATGAGAVLLDDDEESTDETETTDTSVETDDTTDTPEEPETDPVDTPVTDTAPPTTDADEPVDETSTELSEDGAEADNAPIDIPDDITDLSDKSTDTPEGDDDTTTEDPVEGTPVETDSSATDDPEVSSDDNLEDGTEEPIETDETVDESVTDTTESTEVPNDGGILEDFTKEDKTDAIVILAGIIAVIAAVYTIGARIDDWFKYRR